MESKPGLAPLGVAPDPSTHPIFDRARDAFLSSLSPAERVLFSPCFSVDDVQAATVKLQAVTNEAHGRILEGNTAIQVIHRLGEALNPYFKIIEIFISSNPQYAAVIWGGIRLVLQMASNFVTFFGKFLQLMSTLAESLSEYKAILGLCMAEAAIPGSQDRLEFSLVLKRIEAVYGDILNVLRAAVHVFTRNNGRIKRTPMVIADLLWRPFDTRFGELVQSIKGHRSGDFRESLSPCIIGCFR
ncbi:hypothetical protein B0T16DRAFT_141096 [Cercophora newfieldiana]|uniref:DUF7708 domain-containing protein n=1 Tax=Cercophora newfieldiana TaxID=92897 RepID=A0AA39Y3T0_9PEZI|nr:hypothetical protein B0T16DRAFT_141096 [Cercophora newfieldiana]